MTETTTARATSGQAPRKPVFLDVRGGAVKDFVHGLKIFNLMGLSSRPESVYPTLVYVKMPYPIGKPTREIRTIAVKMNGPEGRLILLTEHGPKLVTPGMKVTPIHGTYDTYDPGSVIKHLRFTANVAGHSHSIVISNASRENWVNPYAVLSSVTKELGCVSFPDAFHMKWDHFDYDIVFVLPAFYAPKDNPSNESEQDCVLLQARTINAKFAYIYPLNDLFVTSRNLYIAYLHSIYVIPFKYFSPHAVSKSRIVFAPDDINRAIWRSKNRFVSQRDWRSKCPIEESDCAQMIVDDALTGLTHGFDGEVK